MWLAASDFLRKESPAGKTRGTTREQRAEKRTLTDDAKVKVQERTAKKRRGLRDDKLDTLINLLTSLMVNNNLPFNVVDSPEMQAIFAVLAELGSKLVGV